MEMKWMPRARFIGEENSGGAREGEREERSNNVTERARVHSAAAIGAEQSPG